MRIYEIKSLDCEDPQNRKLLVKEVMKTAKIEKKPSLSDLKKIAKKHEQQNMKLFAIYFYSEHISGVMKVDGGFSELICKSEYELYCKLILMFKAYKKLKNKRENI